MNYSDFIGKNALAPGEEKGIVVSFDKKFVTLDIQGVLKTYAWDIAYRKGNLRFEDPSLNEIIDLELGLKEKQEKENEELVKRKAEEYNKVREWAINEYKTLAPKNKIMKRLFGNDFLYPPYVKFMKKYGHLIPEDQTLRWLQNHGHYFGGWIESTYPS